jgi:uncharacterized protein (TIGR00255 family)
MIQSMTGFGASEKDGFRVEIRSLNHRFIDISLKLNPLLMEHEIPMRNILKKRFSRGKFDVSVSMTDDGKAMFRLNTGLAKKIYEGLNNLKSELSIPGTIGIESLLHYKELLISERGEYNVGSLYDSFNEAISQLERMRVDEGRALSEDILNRVGKLESIKDEIVALSPKVVDECKRRFHERLKELLGDLEYDKNRMLQEIAILIEKTDITEEFTRIENHIKQFRKVILSDDTIGKRLDFLLQELNREANTIASKANNYRISSIIIEMKNEIEKIREQVQNIQ